MPAVKHDEVMKNTFCARTCCTPRPEPSLRTFSASLPFPNLYKQNPFSSATSLLFRNVHSSIKESASLYLSNLINATSFSLAAWVSVGEDLRISFEMERISSKSLEEVAMLKRENKSDRVVFDAAVVVPGFLVWAIFLDVVFRCAVDIVFLL
jgi:hypothetical protein